ncbi:UNVERIFIED_CONTAM: hypothetical protein PYX00_006592 [Menopon gallinae]|uniref:Uncharacterized protein n=1 Tax=Menopon gallinae TaxID=328185 RepID=A0AAW2HVR2_9NEOP
MPEMKVTGPRSRRDPKKLSQHTRKESPEGMQESSRPTVEDDHLQWEPFLTVNVEGNIPRHHYHRGKGSEPEGRRRVLSSPPPLSHRPCGVSTHKPLGFGTDHSVRKTETDCITGQIADPEELGRRRIFRDRTAEVVHPIGVFPVYFAFHRQISAGINLCWNGNALCLLLGLKYRLLMIIADEFLHLPAAADSLRLFLTIYCC